MNNSEKIKQYLDELKNDPILKGYHITLDNANDFAVYAMDKKSCQSCKGLNECKTASVGYRTAVTKSDKGYLFSLNECLYHKEMREKNDNSNFISNLFVATEAMNASLDDFEITNNERKVVFAEAKKAINVIKKGEFAKGLLLSGKFSTGKTYLLAAIANELSKSHIQTLVVYFPELIRELKASIDKGIFSELYYKLKSVDVLLIDDLGSEMMTSWVRDEILGPLLNYRLEAKLPLFLSTNLGIDAFIEHIATTKDSGKDMTKATRIMDRIKGLTKLSILSEKTFDR